MHDLSFYLRKLSNFKRIPFFRKFAFNYLKSQNPIRIQDINFKTKYSNSYALISEIKSQRFQKIINRLNCYIGSGPIGPGKLWEYPWVLANLRLKEGMSILDVGCGTSPIQYLLSDLNLKVYGIDPYEGAKWHGINRKLTKFYGCNIDYQVESGSNMSYEDNMFDRVCCISVIEHIRAKEVQNHYIEPHLKEDLELQRKIVKEMIRVLKPGGICVITTDFVIPRNNILIDSNINIANLMDVEGVKLIEKKIEEPFYGEPNFDFLRLINRSDIAISNYLQILATSVGLTLKKITN